jgi:glycosyltransferase involved in cell wall biosynthesis
MGSPSVSVIVTAHHRREFLLAAVGSVLEQRPDPGAVEVLVVKNYTEPALDARLDELGVRRIETEAIPLGAKLALGIDAAQAPVLAFLEDDDLFLPGRLARLRAAFEDATLGYYHNAAQVIDRTGEPRATSFHEGARVDHTLPSDDRRRADVRAFLQIGPAFNLSSTAVRREALAAARPYLARTNLTCDNLVCYAALLAPFGLMNDGHPWTGYRLHASASWTPSEPNGFFSKESAKWAAIVDGFDLIVEMTRGTPIAPFAEADRILRKGMRTLAAAPGEASFTPRDFLHLLESWSATTEGVSVGRTVAALALRTIAPPLERRLYAEYVRSQARELGVA